jgi:hypothetical protein
MFDKVKDFATKETIYPGQFDTIFYTIGYERAEIDLLKAGRIPSNQINMGKSSKTIIEYGGQELVFDSVCSWVNITGLTQSKLYRIKAYTADEFGNKSVPQEIALIPYTASDLSILSVSPPRVIASPWAVTLTWPTLSSVLLNYCDLSYTYTDKDGKVLEGICGENPKISMENLNAGEATSIVLKYRIVPIMNGEAILDTVILEKSFSMYMPTSDGYQRDLENRAFRSIQYSASQDVKINWLPVDNYTLQYTTIKYTDTSDPDNPFETTLRVENSEETTIVPGLRIGTPFYISSNYKPEGVEDVYIDSDFKKFEPDILDYDERTSWTGTASHAYATDGGGPDVILDGNFGTFMSLAKPGKTANGSTVPVNELAGFTLDLQQELCVDYFRIYHRNTTPGLRIWAVSIYGSHDRENWSKIVNDLTVTNYSIAGTMESPNIPIPRSYFRYLKIEYTQWDPKNNSAIQLAEFYLGVSKNPI